MRRLEDEWGSIRSQKAEGFKRQLKKDGIDPKGIDPQAIKAMAGVGINILSLGYTEF